MPKRILIAEDEALTRRWTSAWLRDIGYDVSEAINGAEAIDLIERSHFDLVLADLRMPRVDGVRVLMHLRSASPKTPFIILSVAPSDAECLAGMSNCAVLGKPIS